MLAGSEGIGGIYFDDPGIARFIGYVALNFILFSGGLETRWEVIKPVFWHGLTLSTAGVLITAVSVGVFVWAVTDFTFLEGLLLGSIVSSTDAAAGLIFGRLGKELINRIKLNFEGLYPVLVIALMFLTWSFTDFIGGNGFLAIYLAAVYLGNQYLIHKKTIMQVFDGLAWLMQIVLFLTLGLLVFPSHIVPIIGIGMLVSAFLIFVARPLSVFIALIPFKIKLRNLTFISWVGLRGAVPIVFATYPLLEGCRKSRHDL